jgi:hypothetical protein
MMSGAIHTSWIDSLQAAFAGVQVNNPEELNIGNAHTPCYTVSCSNLK